MEQHNDEMNFVLTFLIFTQSGYQNDRYLYQIDHNLYLQKKLMIILRWQWCWWHRYVGDLMFITILRCWWRVQWTLSIRDQLGIRIWKFYSEFQIAWVAPICVGVLLPKSPIVINFLRRSFSCNLMVLGNGWVFGNQPLSDRILIWFFDTGYLWQ